MDVREKLIEILRKPIFPHELVDPTEAVADYLLDSGVTVQDDCAELKKAMNRLGRFGRLFVDYHGCPRGRNGRAGVPLEEEVLLIPKITDVDGGEWIPVNADALHELVGQFKKMREISLQTHESVQNVPETNVGEWISVKDRLPKIRDDGFADAFLVTDGSLAHIAYFVDGEWIFTYNGEMKESMFYEVTHWQPLPQPPKGE